MSIGRRTTAVILALTLVLGLPGLGFASFPDTTGTRFADGAGYLQSLGVLVGDPDGSFYPLRSITRAEAAKVVVLLIGQGGQASPDQPAAFPDTLGHWANGFIARAKALGIINGYPNGDFGPEDPVTYAQMAKMLLESAGLGPDATQSWPDNYMGVARARGLFATVPTYPANSPAFRGDCAVMAAHTVRSVPNPGTGLTLAQSVFGTVRSMEMSPAQVTAAVGGSVQFEVTLRDAAGNAIEGLPVGYTTSDRTNAGISAAGLFRAVRAGVYSVSASSAGLTRSVTVTVLGAAAGLRATPHAGTLTATGRSSLKVTVEVVDAAGSRLANVDGVLVTMSHVSGGSNGAVTLGTTVKTLAAGVAEFEVTATTRSGRTDTLVFRAPGLPDATASVATVTPVPTRLGLTAEPASLPVNRASTGQVTATILDQSGVPMTGAAATVVFTIAGAGTFGGSTAPLTRATSAGSATVSIASVQGASGNIIVGAAAPGVLAGQVAIGTYAAGSPAALRLVLADTQITAGQTGSSADRARFQVELVDAEGRPATQDYPVALTLCFSDDAELASRGLAVSGDLTIDAGRTRTGDIFVGAASASAGQAGSHTIRINPDDGGLLPASFEATVRAGAAAMMRLSLNEAAKLSLVNPHVDITVQLADAAGNQLAQPGVEIRAGWQDPSPVNHGTLTLNGVLNPPADANSSQSVRVSTDAFGRAVFQFAAQAYVGDDYRLVFRSGSLAVTSPALSIVTATAGSTTIKFTNGSGGTISRVKADQSEVAYAEILVRDDSGNPLGGWDVSLEFGDAGVHVQNVIRELGAQVQAYSGGTIVVRTPNSPGSADHGKIRLSFQGAQAGTLSLTARPLTAAPGASTARSLRVDPGSVVVGVRVTTSAGGATNALAVTGDKPVSLRLVVADFGGNAIPAPGAVAVLVDPVHGLYSSNTAGEFRLTDVGIGLPTGGIITIGRGLAQLTVFYVQAASQSGLTIGLRAAAEAFVVYQIEFTSATLGSGATPPAQMVFRVKDAAGTGIAGVRVDFHASAGSLAAASALTGGDGRVTVSWTGGTGGTLWATVRDALDGAGGAIDAVGGWPVP